MTGKKAAWMIAAGVTLAGLESGAPPLGARHEVVQPVATTLRVQQINPTTVEVFFQDNKCIVFDFYGDNIFRMFRDDQGGILRSPASTPPARILVAQPRAKSVNVQATTEGNAAIIQSGKVTIRIDGTSRLMTVTENETGKVLLEEYAPWHSGKARPPSP